METPRTDAATLDAMCAYVSKIDHVVPVKIAAEIETELTEMRQAMSQVVENIGNGSFATVHASHEWMTKEVPEEVRLYCIRLRRELAHATKLIDKASVQMKSDRGTNEKLIDAYIQHNKTMDAELAAEREKVAKLKDTIRRARTKFCEDGADGKIAAEMFQILGESREETK